MKEERKTQLGKKTKIRKEKKKKKLKKHQEHKTLLQGTKTTVKLHLVSVT